MSNKLELSLYDIALAFDGLKEVPGQKDNPFIVWCLSLCSFPDAHDETAWCSAFMNGICFITGLPRTKSAAARSWLKMGVEVKIEDAQAGDIIIFKRGPEPQPGPEVLNAQGHVAIIPEGQIIYGTNIRVFGGNQDNKVCHGLFPAKQVLSIRRLT